MRGFESQGGFTWEMGERLFDKSYSRRISLSGRASLVYMRLQFNSQHQLKKNYTDKSTSWMVKMAD